MSRVRITIDADLDLPIDDLKARCRAVIAELVATLPSDSTVEFDIWVQEALDLVHVP